MRVCRVSKLKCVLHIQHTHTMMGKVDVMAMLISVVPAIIAIITSVSSIYIEPTISITNTFITSAKAMNLYLGFIIGFGIVTNRSIPPRNVIMSLVHLALILNTFGLLFATIAVTIASYPVECGIFNWFIYFTLCHFYPRCKRTTQSLPKTNSIIIGPN